MDIRLRVLLDNDIIDQEVFDYCMKSYEFMVGEGISGASLEVLITHLAMASQRIKTGDVVNAMDQMILDEIQKSHEFSKAKDLTSKILSDSNTEFPESEEAFLWLHLTNVLRENGGDIRT